MPDPHSRASHDLHALSDADHERLARHVMARQASLSLRVAAVFIVLLVGLPLVNAYAPDLASRQIFGFTATWLFLGVLFYPVTLLLSAYFVKKSDEIEAECSDWRGVLGIREGEPLEPQGVGEIKPAFVESDLPRPDPRD
jgi:uncharacterized membrane protein (DUF485 family)